MSPLFLGFLGVSFLVLATPGPDTALTVRNSLLGGRRGGVFTAAGIVTGQTIWVLATSVGLVAVVAACEPVFEAIKWLGSAYLVWLGATALWAAWRGKQPAVAAGTAAAPASRLSSASAFRQGLLSDLGNPKMAVFFSSLLPQFASEATFTSLALLGLVFCAMTFTWLAGYAIMLSLVGDYVRRRSVWRTIEAITGAALMALGLKLAAEQR